MDNNAAARLTEQSTMEFIEAWVREHINVARYRPSEGDARAIEFAKWLRKDDTASGISDPEIDRAIAGSIAAGHGLTTYISDAMATVADTSAPTPVATLLANEDF